MYYNITTWCYRMLNWFFHSKIHTNFQKCTFSLIICYTSLNICNLGMHSPFFLFRYLSLHSYKELHLTGHSTLPPKKDCHQKKFAVATDILPPKVCRQNFAVSFEKFTVVTAVAMDKLLLQV